MRDSTAAATSIAAEESQYSVRHPKCWAIDQKIARDTRMPVNNPNITIPTASPRQARNA
ncbi:hypothetical protein [Caballeronia hypogeia]|uniref:hypothetical protein n=1 Tax=Caballeronia hypogeia TaxID=1777140 RepID=UPI001E410128|nr:hypothetical protein [Caballeronia hypogeia]